MMAELLAYRHRRAGAERPGLRPARRPHRRDPDPHASWFGARARRCAGAGRRPARACALRHPAEDEAPDLAASSIETERASSGRRRPSARSPAGCTPRCSPSRPVAACAARFVRYADLVADWRPALTLVGDQLGLPRRSRRARPVTRRRLAGGHRARIHAAGTPCSSCPRPRADRASTPRSRAWYAAPPDDPALPGSRDRRTYVAMYEVRRGHLLEHSSRGRRRQAPTCAGIAAHSGPRLTGMLPQPPGAADRPGEARRVMASSRGAPARVAACSCP